MASRRNLSLAAALVGLVALVAIASRAHSPAGGGGGTHGVDSKVIWEFVLLGIIGLFVLFVPVAAWVILSTGADALRLRSQRRRAFWRVLVGLTVLLIAFVVAVGRFHVSNNSKTTPPNSKLLKTRPAKPDKLGKEVPFDWLPVIAVLSVAGVGAVAIGYALFRRPPGRREPTRAEVAAQLSLVLDESLEDLRSERDPRRAVIGAYARMERTLAGAGLPRSVAEAPLEYLARILRDLLHTSADAVSRLTVLFERAKFSPHQIDRGMKDEAIDALVAVRDELRAAAS
jgi:Domain of unknown function (DUF4129)